MNKKINFLKNSLMFLGILTPIAMSSTMATSCNSEKNKDTHKYTIDGGTYKIGEISTKWQDETAWSLYRDDELFESDLITWTICAQSNIVQTAVSIDNSTGVVSIDPSKLDMRGHEYSFYVVADYGNIHVSSNYVTFSVSNTYSFTQGTTGDLKTLEGYWVDEKIWEIKKNNVSVEQNDIDWSINNDFLVPYIKINNGVLSISPTWLESGKTYKFKVIGKYKSQIFTSSEIQFATSNKYTFASGTVGELEPITVSNYEDSKSWDLLVDGVSVYGQINWETNNSEINNNISFSNGKMSINCANLTNATEYSFNVIAKYNELSFVSEEITLYVAIANNNLFTYNYIAASDAYEATINNYGRLNHNVVVPTLYNNKAVVLADSAFKNDTNLQTVYFSNIVTSIPDNAFSGCTNLQYDKIKNIENVKWYGSNSFEGVGSAIKDSDELNINIGEDVQYIGIDVFANCYIDNISISKSNRAYAKARNVKSSKGLAIVDKLSANLNPTCSNIVGCLIYGEIVLPSTCTGCLINSNCNGIEKLDMTDANIVVMSLANVSVKSQSIVTLYSPKTSVNFTPACFQSISLIKIIRITRDYNVVDDGSITLIIDNILKPSNRNIYVPYSLINNYRAHHLIEGTAYAARFLPFGF